MTAYSIKVQDFEGPLDLLVHLIEKDKIDIYDIPIVSVTEQYIAYMNGMKEYNIEIASEFLLMAATLLQIKSKVLLPKPVVEETEDAEDPRELLVRMLVEYRKIKLRAQQLRDCLFEGSKFIARKPMSFPKNSRKVKQMTLNDLLGALAALIPKEALTTAVVPRQEFHVRDKMLDIMNLLQENNNALAFARTLEHANDRGEQIATFLAVLELLRLKRIVIRQKESFAPIYLFLRED